ncbi:MAG: SUMF1/EgtB/PvdO family nonheme iron enzyme, partial [Pseudomonadota bacterium]
TEAVPRLFRALATIDEERQFTSKPLRSDDLLDARFDLKLAVETFVQARLLVATTPKNSLAVIIRLAHEALIQSWPRLNAWLEEAREFLQSRARLESALRRWNEENERDDPKKKPDDVLLPEGKPLADAQALEKSRRDELTPEQIDFIARSAMLHETRRRKRLRQFQAASVVFLVLAVLAVIGGTAALKQTKLAQSQKEAAWLNEAKTTWHTRAKEATERGQFPDSALYAARALGFEGCGFERLPPDQQSAFAEKYPRLFDPIKYPDLEAQLRGLIDRGPVKPGLPIWSSPAANGPASAVNSVGFSPDGRFLAGGDADGTIRIWDLAGGEVKDVFSGHSGAVNSVAFSPDGRFLAGGDDNGAIRIWDLASGEVKAVFSGHADAVNSVVFSPDGLTLASGSEDKTIKLWDVAANEEKATFSGPTGAVASLCFSPNGVFLASGGGDGTIKIWNAAFEVEVFELGRHSNMVKSLNFSPDGRFLASGGADGTIKLWDAAASREKIMFRGHAGEVRMVVFSPDSGILASGGDDGVIKLWDVDSSREKAMFRGHAGEVNSVSFSPDGRTLASGSGDTTVKLWDVGAVAWDPASFELDLATYVTSGWYGFKEETGECYPVPSSSNVSESKACGFVNVGPWTHVGALQGGRTPEERNGKLFRHYVLNGAFSGALALLDQPMDEAPDVSPLLDCAKELLEESGQNFRARIFFDHLRETKWGRAHSAALEQFASGSSLSGFSGQTFTNTIGQKFVLLPFGTFMMGSPESEQDRSSNERLHSVTISRDFYLQTTEVAQGQWRAVMVDNPSEFKDCGDDCPVGQVSWEDAQAFVARLNAQEGTDKYRLPTEAEWEYGARAGSGAAYCFGDDVSRLTDYAWYGNNSGEKTHAVGGKEPNAWGLYDMHGNFWEWCQDWYDDYPSDFGVGPAGPSFGSSRVLRGGSWVDSPGFCRSAVRSGDDPGNRFDVLGFRLARTK